MFDTRHEELSALCAEQRIQLQSDIVRLEEVAANLNRRSIYVLKRGAVLAGIGGLIASLFNRNSKVGQLGVGAKSSIAILAALFGNLKRVLPALRLLRGFVRR